LGHTSDIHIIDAQSPARLEPVGQFSTTLIPGSFRPQESMSVHVQAQMVAALAAVARSPLSGATMSAVINTGDNADQLSHLELRWFIDVMDGVPVTPDSGAPGVYEGAQVWPEATWVYHPDDPADNFGAYGFPRIPGLMTAVVSGEVDSGGLPVPWYTVYGNHDQLFDGTFQTDSSLRNLATGSRKPWAFTGLVGDYLRGMASDTSPATRAIQALGQQFGRTSGMKIVTADPARRMLQGLDFMAAHFQTTPRPGPVGHGFTQANLDNGTRHWQADIGDVLRLFGLDTCSQVLGADGAVPKDQFDWLQAGLAQATADNRLAIVVSHHNSLTLENNATAVSTPGQPLIHAEQFIAMLAGYPNVVAWLNGHTHVNTITAHPAPAGSKGAGFWEITTASCADYPQQQQVVEIMDNRDGTLSLICTVLDHLSPAEWTPGDFSQVGIASLSRQLASNDWVADPMMRRGSPLDRNVELLLPAPLDMARFTDAALSKAELARAAAALATTGGR
jgi:metallophosphoesterase (TIGR03767 family)